jgi:hypothetical protein
MRQVLTSRPLDRLQRCCAKGVASAKWATDAQCSSLSSCCSRFCILQLQLSAPPYLVVLSPFFIPLPPDILSRTILGKEARRSASEEVAQQEIGGARGGRPTATASTSPLPGGAPPPQPRPRHPLQDPVASSRAPPALVRQSGGPRGGGGGGARTGEELGRGGARHREEVEAVVSPPRSGREIRTPTPPPRPSRCGSSPAHLPRHQVLASPSRAHQCPARISHRPRQRRRRQHSRGGGSGAWEEEKEAAPGS